jgi:hypothetical protein
MKNLKNKARFRIVGILDVASHYIPALVPVYVRAVHWSEDKAQEGR